MHLIITSSHPPLPPSQILAPTKRPFFLVTWCCLHARLRPLKSLKWMEKYFFPVFILCAGKFCPSSLKWCLSGLALGTPSRLMSLDLSCEPWFWAWDYHTSLCTPSSLALAAIGQSWGQQIPPWNHKKYQNSAMAQGLLKENLKGLVNSKVGWGVERWEENQHNKVYFQMWYKVIQVQYPIAKHDKILTQEAEEYIYEDAWIHDAGHFPWYMNAQFVSETSSND